MKITLIVHEGNLKTSLLNQTRPKVYRFGPVYCPVYGPVCSPVYRHVMLRCCHVDKSQHPWALGQGIVRGKFQGNCNSYHVDGLNQTDLFKEDASLKYVRYWSIT